MGFPHAIRQVLLMGPPTSSHGLPDLALDGAMLGFASRELLAITAILRDRQDQLVAEAERRNPIATRFLDLSHLEAAEMFVSDTLGANPYLPTGYMVSTWWVLKQNTQHGPTRSMLITF